MKKFFAFALVLFFSFSVHAQSNFIVRSNNNGLYLTHTVSAKENFYSIGRLYNISPKDIAAFNAIDMASGLSVGQSIMIPLNSTNFTQTTQKGVPVYYVVGSGEGLYRVSVNNNKVLLANLRKWNNLSSNAVSPGQRLIIGYITSDAAATTAITNATASKPEASAPTPKQETASTTIPAPAPHQQETVVQSQPSQQTKPVATTATAANNGSGYFKSQFEAQIRKFALSKDETVTSGIFKTTSGWQDGKYYALMDGVEPGTIIRVINPNNNKAVYAKVLGEMSGIRQNAGLNVRISNAAASALEVSDSDKFIVKVNY